MAKKKLSAVKRLEIESACLKLSARYGIYFDNGNYDAWMDLWAEKGEWHLPARAPLVGKKAINAFIRRLPGPGPLWRHMCTNLWVDAVDAKNAVGEAYTIIFHADRPADGSAGKLGVPESVVQFRDRFVFEKGKWRFALRHTTRVFKS